MAVIKIKYCRLGVAHNCIREAREATYVHPIDEHGDCNSVALDVGISCQLLSPIGSQASGR
jgi:hypothetical protein